MLPAWIHWYTLIFVTFHQFIIKYPGTYALYLVHIRKAHFYDLIYQTKSHKTLGLEPQFGRVFERNLKFMFKYIKNCVYLGQIAFNFIFIVLTILLIYQEANWWYTISLIIWFSLTILNIKSFGTVIFSGCFFGYMSILYIQLRFRQLFYRLKTKSSFNLGNDCK